MNVGTVRENGPAGNHDALAWCGRTDHNVNQRQSHRLSQHWRSGDFSEAPDRRFCFKGKPQFNFKVRRAAEDNAKYQFVNEIESQLHRVFEAARISQGRRGVFEVAGGLLVGPALGASLLVFAVTLTEFAVPQLLRVRTVGEAIYERIQEGELATAAALSLPLLPLVVAAGAAGALILVRSRSASMAGIEGEVPKFTGAKAGPFAELLGAVMTLIAITPSLIVPATSLIWLAAVAKLPPPSAMGTHKLLRASGFADSFKGAWDLAHDDAVRTVLLASFAATIATTFSIVLARLASRTMPSAVQRSLGILQGR